MKHYFITFCILISSLKVLINCNTIADVSIVITPKESLGNNSSSWSNILKNLDLSKSQEQNSKTNTHTTLKKEKDSQFIDYFFNPALFFKRNNITTTSILNRISSDFTRIVYSRAHSISNFY